MPGEEVVVPKETTKNYEVREGKAYVKAMYEGKEAEFVLRGLTVQELSYSIDEFMTVSGNGNVSIKVGAMVIALLPKSLVKAPFPITDNKSVLNAPGGLIFAFVEPLLELNGLNLAGAKTKN